MTSQIFRELETICPDIVWETEDRSVCARIPASHLRAAAIYLHEREWRLGTLVAREYDRSLEVRYCFYATLHDGWLQLLVAVDPAERTLPSIVSAVIAADWFEREIEDLFSIRFTQHPRLGDFVLHDDRWAENLGLMRPHLKPDEVKEQRREWTPKRVLEEEGSFVMPVGPIYSGDAESALFLLETVGEDVVRAVPRLFFKYRAIEKLAEGKTPADVLLLAERCNGTSAIGNGLAYCEAVERALGVNVPRRAIALRTFFAELERIRHHTTSIREICASTALTVAASQALWLEERLLRVSGELAGHRYFFGVLELGGLRRDFDTALLRSTTEQVASLLGRVEELGTALASSNSFLDRIEQIGIVSAEQAHTFELVGPFARASGVAADLRVLQPYAGYSDVVFDVPIEREGDGYARLRVLFAEMKESLRIMRALELPDGTVHASPVSGAGRALGWTEAPRGASVQWVEVDRAGAIVRYRLTPPSFRNWHGFHLATEDFAFQDFPIILATLDLSVAENDR
ncbi:MAG TPA: NADH-quinone oxidoreductase subunit C [Candidatus Acidoferrales bacterium]|nr:NADH-quinone oxidoreductase subunit C [Candidatus Acidoferrales bacterium]